VIVVLAIVGAVLAWVGLLVWALVDERRNGWDPPPEGVDAETAWWEWSAGKHGHEPRRPK
jgi:hypothetical protein